MKWCSECMFVAFKVMKNYFLKFIYILREENFRDIFFQAGNQNYISESKSTIVD